MVITGPNQEELVDPGHTVVSLIDIYDAYKTLVPGAGSHLTPAQHRFYVSNIIAHYSAQLPCR